MAPDPERHAAIGERPSPGDGRLSLAIVELDASYGYMRQVMQSTRRALTALGWRDVQFGAPQPGSLRAFGNFPVPVAV